MTDEEACPECGAAVEYVYGMPGYVACSDEKCDLHNVAFELEERASGA